MYKLELFRLLNKARRCLRNSEYIGLRNNLEDLKVALENLKVLAKKSLSPQQEDALDRSYETCLEILSLIVKLNFVRYHSKEHKNILQKVSINFNNLVAYLGDIGDI